jgi:hypothetical protein
MSVLIDEALTAIVGPDENIAARIRAEAVHVSGVRLKLRNYLSLRIGEDRDTILTVPVATDVQESPTG